MTHRGTPEADLQRAVVQALRVALPRTAIVHHWTAEDRQRHEEMGFHEGWGKATDQLAVLARTL